MSKYNVPLDLETDNSLRWINECLADNSTILEFGPAHGRLTKYLVMNRNCLVDIVEIDTNAGKNAAKYARNSLLGPEEGNIEKFIWAKKLLSNSYDFIIFADVLEHLYNPELVLKKCREFLSKNGKIVVSIPNIAYNGLILNLIHDNFIYTPTGLLDETHIRFFTYNSIVEMAKRLNLHIVYQNAVIEPIGKYAFTGKYEEFDNFNLDVIKSHPFGEVYQFIIAMQLTPGDVIDKLTPIAENVKKKYSNYANPDQIIKEKSELLEKVLNSKSWRFTAPLRFICKIFHCF